MDVEATTSPAALATALFEALNRRDFDALALLDHPDIVDDFVAIGVFRGIGGVRAFFEELFAAFPDIVMEVEHITEDDDHAVVQWRATGTFTGTPFQGLHATGRAVELRGCDVMRFEDGRLRYNTIYYDGLGFARQVGMLPRQGTAADKALTVAFNAGTDVRSKLHRREQPTSYGSGGW
jgi:steroid delta-isomerase-like uncharacterized protein